MVYGLSGERSLTQGIRDWEPACLGGISINLHFLRRMADGHGEGKNLVWHQLYRSAKRRNSTKAPTMPNKSPLTQQQSIIGSLQPAISSPQNWNYEIPESLYDAYMH